MSLLPFLRLKFVEKTRLGIEFDPDLTYRNQSKNPPWKTKQVPFSIFTYITLHSNCSKKLPTHSWSFSILNTNKLFMLISGWTCTNYASASLILKWIIIIQKHFKVFFMFSPLLILHAFTDHLFIQPTMTRSLFVSYPFILFSYNFDICSQFCVFAFVDNHDWFYSWCVWPQTMAFWGTDLSWCVMHLYKLDNIWMPSRGCLLFIYIFFMLWHQLRIWNWTNITMHHGWCTLVERGWYLFSIYLFN